MEQTQPAMTLQRYLVEVLPKQTNKNGYVSLVKVARQAGLTYGEGLRAVASLRLNLFEGKWLLPFEAQSIFYYAKGYLDRGKE